MTTQSRHSLKVYSMQHTRQRVFLAAAFRPKTPAMMNCTDKHFRSIIVLYHLLKGLNAPIHAQVINNTNMWL